MVKGSNLNGFPFVSSVSESVDWQGYRFEVVDMDGRRIDKVLIQPPQE